MEFDGLQMTLIVVFLLSAVAVVVVCQFLRETFQRRKAALAPYWHDSRGSVPVPFQVLDAKRLTHPLIVDVPPVEPEPELTTLETQPETQEPASPSAPLPEPTVDAFLWTQPTPAVFRLIQGGSGSSMPVGMIDQTALQEMIESGAPFSGALVSVSVTDSDGSMWHSTGLMRSVSKDIAGLLGGRDFGCRTAFDEFLLVYPQAARGCLQKITERLWDCQLHGTGAGSVLFTWGGVEVENQTLAAAIAAANERMRQSKRVSDSISAVSSHACRQAV